MRPGIPEILVKSLGRGLWSLLGISVEKLFTERLKKSKSGTSSRRMRYRQK
jgi:hypothetical protein